MESFPAEEGNVRELTDCNPLPSFRRRVEVPTRRCPRCRKPIRHRGEGVLPKTRGVMMSVLHTLNARCTDPAAQLVKALNHYAQDRGANMFDRVFGGLTLYVPAQ